MYINKLFFLVNNRKGERFVGVLLVFLLGGTSIYILLGIIVLRVIFMRYFVKLYV